jgi:hypothetical protein
MKAHALYVEEDVWGPVFEDPSYAWPDYPVLYPALEALSADAAGRFDPGLIHAVPAVTLVAFGLASWAVLRTVVPGWLAALTALAAMGQPQLVANFGDNYADGAVAAAISVGLLLVAVWLRAPAGTSALALGACLLCAAGLVKQEALLFVVAALLVAVVLRALAGQSLRPLGAAALVAFVPPAAWLAVAHARGLDSDTYAFARLADAGFLEAESDRFVQAIDWMLTALERRWEVALILLACTAAIAILARARQVPVFVLGWAWLSFVGLAATYLVSRTDLEWHLATSADRVVMTIGVTALVCVPLVVVDAVTGRPDERPSPPAPD